MGALAIWLGAAGLYALFLAWYQNLRGRITAAEIERHLVRLEALGVSTPDERRVLRAFLEADDGREFLMLNLIRVSREPIRNPASGELEPARRVLERYTGPFLRALFRRAGHPAFLGFPLGGFVDTWGFDPGPGWTMTGLMRYRSRRDLIELVATEMFAGAHPFKHAAMPISCAFPIGRIRLFAGPRVLLGLLLALAAALAHLLLLR